jgi:hypothetical protein
MSSITGAAVAAVLVGLVQQFANYYAASGVGDPPPGRAVERLRDQVATGVGGGQPRDGL